MNMQEAQQTANEMNSKEFTENPKKEKLIITNKRS